MIPVSAAVMPRNSDIIPCPVWRLAGRAPKVATYIVSVRLLQSADDIGFGEVRAFIEQRRAFRFRKRVRRAVAEIQSRWMPALAVFVEGGSCDGGLPSVERNDLDLGAPDQCIQEPPRCLILDAACQNHRRFEESDGGHNDRFRRAYSFGEKKRVRFVLQNRNQRRAIDRNHAGKPF